MVHLTYVGPGYVIGVPAEDVDVDPDEAERLVATGLYLALDQPAPEAEHAEDESVPAHDADVTDDVPVGE